MLPVFRMMIWLVGNVDASVWACSHDLGMFPHPVFWEKSVDIRDWIPFFGKSGKIANWIPTWAGGIRENQGLDPSFWEKSGKITTCILFWGGKNGKIADPIFLRVLDELEDHLSRSQDFRSLWFQIIHQDPTEQAPGPPGIPGFGNGGKTGFWKR